MLDMDSIALPTQRQFNPYSENGGTILAIAGADFTVIASDTRQSEGYSIQTRYAPKVFRLYASLSPHGPRLPTPLAGPIVLFSP
ncbi:hypothetical protein J3R83DRAFT_13289 [Lanmaoa asiatica]|nr:hypothetical protein J3R83DRAFT_13289 [Lanmaoa asiatica]